ncbi:MAG TPA: DUF1801 domain-containing protein [Phycisphaerales bacterium]|nr:DUF1801 domain-containing protein [Phycisphaerales bacterium]
MVRTKPARTPRSAKSPPARRVVRSKLDPRKADLSHQKVDAKTGQKQYGTRADLGAPVEVALSRMPEPIRSIAWAVDGAIRRLSKKVDAKVSWGHASYVVDGHDLFAIGECKDRVNLYVGNGTSVPDPDGVLEGIGKTMRHVKVRSVEQAESRQVSAILKASLAAAKKGADNAWKRGKKA